MTGFQVACLFTIFINTINAGGCPSAPKGYHAYAGHCVGSGGKDCAPQLPGTPVSCNKDLRQCFLDAQANCTANPDCKSFALRCQSGNEQCDCTTVEEWQTFSLGGDSVVANSDWLSYTQDTAPTPPTPPPTPAPCTSDLDCSLNGVCTKGRCSCDKPWVGAKCETMKFKPVTFPQGYGMSPNITAWGGSAIFDGNLYHLYVSRMTNNCSLSTWTSSSRIDHAVSSKITGPYQFVGVAVNTWSHNAAPVALKDGTFAIFHIGDGAGAPDGGPNCTHQFSSAWNTRASTNVMNPSSMIEPQGSWNSKAGLQGGSSIHVAKSLNGPWEPLSPNTLGGCNNPAPWVHPNGTIYIVCGNSFKRAENISGPWTTVASFGHSGGPAGAYEDPYLYTDKRGHFHALYHVYNTGEDKYQCVNSTVSAHIFSLDGYQWHTSSVQPYTTQIALSSGETITVSTRERPKLFFDQAGQMTHLFNGVCSATACPPPTGPRTGCVDCKYKHWDYNLVAPLDV